VKLCLVNKFNVGACVRYPSRVFLSVLPTDSGFIGAVREYDPHHGSTRTDVRLIGFDPGGFVRSDDFLVNGEDPRLFRWGQNLFVLTWMETGQGDWYLWLVDVNAKAKVQLKIQPWMFHGKNWAPFVMGDALYILRSLDPLVVLKVDPVSGTCLCVCGCDSRASIGQYRGGGAAALVDGFVTGFGHRTHGPSLHTVFRYSIDPNHWRIETEEVEVCGAQGMGIVDPTSSWPGFVCICATESFWWQWQPVLHGLFKVEE
jgi:hypothetical protein